MEQGRLVAVAAALVVALAGCGGSGDKSNRKTAYKPPAATTPTAAATGDATKLDAGAKSQARTLVTAVETCFVDQMDYTACRKPEGVTVKMGSGPGQVEVSDAGTATYTVVAHSESGTTFTAEKGDSGAVKRSCDKPGEGGCKAGGTW